MFGKLLAAQIFVLSIFAIGMALVLSWWVEPALLAQRQNALHDLGQRLIDTARPEMNGATLPTETSSPHITNPATPPITLQWLQRDAVAEPALELPEVQAALRGKPADRLTNSLNSSPRYLAVALPILNGHQTTGVLRLSQSLADIDTTVTRLWTAVVGLTLPAVAVAIVLSGVLAGRWSKKLETVRAALTLLPAASPTEKPNPAPDSSDEFSELSRTLTRTRSQLVERIQRIDQVRRDLQSMLETIPEAVLAVDGDQRVLFANSSTYRLFDLPPHDISGQKLWEILRQPGLQDAVSMTFASRDPTSSEFEIRYPPRILSFHGRGLAVGAGRGIIIVLHDVTELRRLERMRQEFFASVSHELKTPLASIKAYTETLLDEEAHDPRVVARFLRRIDEQADRLHTLVIDMLTLARVESEDHGFDRQPIDLGRAAEAAVEAFREKAQAKGLALTFERASESATVLADIEGLGMILRNLIDNAIKYTQADGKVTVAVSREGLSAVVRVIDTGIGIPTDDLTRVFERFYRVDKARSRELGGTGLGLSIVKHLVGRFGGTVSVRSRLHEGSTFAVTLPCSPNQPVDTLDSHLKEQEVIA